MFVFRHLIRMDVLSASDPLVVVQEFNPATGGWREVGRTEWQKYVLGALFVRGLLFSLSHSYAVNWGWGACVCVCVCGVLLSQEPVEPELCAGGAPRLLVREGPEAAL